MNVFLDNPDLIKEHKDVMRRVKRPANVSGLSGEREMHAYELGRRDAYAEVEHAQELAEGYTRHGRSS